ncbi:MAG: SDR family oxidoreductase [Candidatus Chisholmbacteria bacterium]|nr:SDR family oxidoreductase [Candidatus Chisholmbacteria bacterium]
MNLPGKTALVTGGSSGLGLSIAKQLLQEKVKVVICGRSQAGITKATKQLGTSNLVAEACDVSNFSQVTAFTKKIGHIDILINNAGVWLEGALENNSVEKINETIDVNLKGVIYTTKAVLPQMKQKNDGYIVNISSTSGIKEKENQAVYVASKYGVRGFTDSLKLDLKNTNIKVMGLYPGGMNTPLFKKAGYPKENQDWMDPDKVADVVVFALKQDDTMILDHIVINKRLTKPLN